MADDAEDSREFGPTYKTLFLGACLIIGATFGWWLTNFIATIDLAHRSYEATFRDLERRLAAVETGESRASWELEGLKRDLADIKRKVDK